jgi:pyruvate formate lyase activating enzyme
LKIAKKTDCFLYDLKLIDSEKHKKYTGVSNELILSNLQELAKTDVDIQIRIPLIKSVNDDIDNITRTARFISELQNKSIKVNILPYHNIAEKKYEKLGDIYKEGTMSEPDSRKIEEIIKIFKLFEIDAKS